MGIAQQQILKLMADGKVRTAREIANETGMTYQKVQNRLPRLGCYGDDNRLLDTVDEARPRRYMINEAGRALVQ